LAVKTTAPVWTPFQALFCTLIDMMPNPTEDFFFVRPASNEKIRVGERDLGNPLEKLYTGVPKVGLVISTYGAPAYVDLALAVRNRLYPDVPVLVHDDASEQADSLMAVCQSPGVTFESNSSRLGHDMGDLSSIVGGLGWAQSLGLDLLVKMSRRFVPATNWIPRLQQIAEVSQYSTFGRSCRTYRLPLRTECFAMAVGPWSADEIRGEMSRFMLTAYEPFLVEFYVSSLARKVYAGHCVAAREWEKQTIRISPKPEFVVWDLLGEGRRTPVPGHLWHETAKPEQYAELGTKLGRTYPVSAFAALAGFASQTGL
jgi:hypothetical protein